jgi:RNA polymerase sigma-70 factor (ECF subfamily)
MESSEDQAYIDRVKAGDSLAYACLVDKYKNMAFTIALKVTGNREEAEDVAQEGFLKAYQQLGTFAGRSKFSTWLYTIVYRTALNHRQRNRNHPFSLDPQADHQQPAAHTTPANEQLQAKQEQQYVKEAIDRLPPTEALLVTLYYLDENSTREIGEITGMSLANIKIKLFRARKRLEKDLAFLL